MTLFKLSLKNIRKSIKDYSIYFMTLIFGVMIFYIFNSIDSQTAMLELNSSKRDIVQSLVKMMAPVSVFVSFILGYLIVYSNNFLIRRRKKEFGIYQTLGMGKGKIASILLTETLIIGMISLCVGLLLGVFLSQGLSVVVAKMFEADITQYEFTFSMVAVQKTCLYFGIIYVVVIIFNTITISRFRLIQLLTAAKRNQKLKVKKKGIIILLFLVSLGLIGFAYYLLIEKQAMLMVGTTFSIMLLCGAIGTYLFFASLAGFLLKLVQLSRRVYLKKLNMFVLNQLNSKINTTTISITVISLMLLLTIGIMASALSLVSATNQDITSLNRSDVTIFHRSNKEYKIPDSAEKMMEDGFPLSNYLNEYVELHLYCKPGMTLLDYITMDDSKQMLYDMGKTSNMLNYSIAFMKQSEYNRLMKLYGLESESVTLKEDQFALVANSDIVVPYLVKQLEAGQTIQIGNKEYIPYQGNVIELALENSNMRAEMGTVVVPDTANLEEFQLSDIKIIGNYKAGTEKEKDAIEEKFLDEVKRFYNTKSQDNIPDTYIFTKLVMEASSVGLSAILTFIGLYLGIIFSITSAAILAIGQLSESTDNKERYAILRKIGVDDKMINHSLFMQIGIYFLLPLAVAFVHSAVGLKEITRIISVYGDMDLTRNIVITALFILIVYGGYFLATYMGSKAIIKEQEKYKD